MSAVTTPPASTSTITNAAPTPIPSSAAATPAPITAAPVSTIPQNLLLTDTGAPTIITDTGATVDPLTMTATDLGQDTSGLLPGDWDVEAWNPALFARTYYGSSMMGCNSCSKNNEYTIMPFGPAYFARAGGFEVEPFRPNVYYAAPPPTAGADIGAWFKQHLCPHVSQTPGKGAVNCYNLWLVLGLGISLVVAGVALK